MVQGTRAGKIAKPYGLQGEVQVILNPLISQHIQEGIPLLIDLDGQRVPFFTESVELPAPDQAIIKFEFISSVEEARKVCGCDLYLDPRLKISDENQEGDPERLVGYTASDVLLGELGEITGFIPGEHNPMWLIDFRGKEMMVPVHANWVQKINHKKGQVLFSLPKGITEL
jgi:16S rRNA processing protein RimM